MAELCNVCSSLQDQLLADGDGSQVVCNCNVDLSQQQTINCTTSESTSKVQSGKKRARNDFISTAEFQTKVSKNKPKDNTKWCDLPLKILVGARFCLLTGQTIAPKAGSNFIFPVVVN